MRIPDDILSYQAEVAEALAKKKAVVALESTLITHGLPYPQNIEVAQALEQTVRDQGAVPATIALIAGEIKVGLNDEELFRLTEASTVRKCSVRDLPIAMAAKLYGATTVAATMVIARRAGIELFATGGIGGVHRGSHWDVSTDLMELGRTPMTVVCAGAKGFLDIPATLEYLETQGVPVLGYQCDRFPAFYSRTSPHAIDFRVENPETMAQIIRHRNRLNLSNALLLTVPIPESDEWPADEAQAFIEKVLAEAETKQIHGTAITPFLLDRMAQYSNGHSVEANTALLKNNARVAAQIANALCQPA